jgi:uncharacterized protein (DUF2236 family)
VSASQAADRHQHGRLDQRAASSDLISVVSPMTEDLGYFPRGSSMLRRVHEERIVGLFFGQRALCIGALAPLNYVGTSEHSEGKLAPFRRLAHTGIQFETIFFGTRAQAAPVLERVARLHETVNGVLPEDAGVFGAGTRYSALDPELMLWTVAVMADSAQYFYELFVARLSDDEREALWRDYIRFAELFGMPRKVAPASYGAFRGWWETKLASEEMFLTAEARYIGHATAFEIPLPRSHQLGKRIHDLIMLGSLPERVRELYGLRYTPAHAAAFVAAVRLVRTAYALTPGALRRGRNTRSFRLVERTERWRIEHGKPTPQVDPGKYVTFP